MHYISTYVKVIVNIYIYMKVVVNIYIYGYIMSIYI